VGAIIVGFLAPRTEEEPKRIELKGRSAFSEDDAEAPAKDIRRRSRFLTALKSRRGDRSTAVPGNQVSMLLPNVGRITLDNFAVLR